MSRRRESRVPLVLCSRGERWGKEVTQAAWETLSAGRSVLDAVERGTNVVELDPEDITVGYGGLPNAEGIVELDASIMDGSTRHWGAVAALRNIKTPTSVARLVMERYGQLLLVGEGALRFATANGFKEEDLLSEGAMSRWRDWREKRGEWGDWVAPEDGKFEERGDSHGTINVLAIDARGGIAGATSTSGLSFKSPGRVGDSPIIGAGLYVDNDVGAAGATGRGEEVIRTCGSEYVVRLMGGGKSPREACVAACRRIIDVAGGIGSVREDRINVKFVAVSREGEVGCAIILGASDNPPQMSYCDATGYHVVEGTILAEKETSPES